MRGTELVTLGILVTFLLLIAFITLLPPTSQFGIPVNPDITVVIEDPKTARQGQRPGQGQGRGRERDGAAPKDFKSRHKETINNDLSKDAPSSRASREMDTQVALLNQRIEGLRTSLEEVSQLATSLKKLISHHAPSPHARESGGYCLPIDQIMIEEITPYLRSPAWHKTKDPSLVEDRSYLHFLASHYIPNNAPRKIYIDLGSASFTSSVGWMLHHYPLTFTEIHAFEEQVNSFLIPPPEQLGKQRHDSIHFHQVRVGVKDDKAKNELNFPKWMKEVLSPSVDDFVVIKMDIEGGEWEVMAQMEQAGLHLLVDELFVEIHYQHADLREFGWDHFAAHTQPEAVALLRHWRALGVYAHYWP